MLVPRRCGSPYDGNGRTAAVGYLTPADLLLDGSTQFGEGQVYNSPIIDATGFMAIKWIVEMVGATDLSMDYEWQYADQFVAANPYPNFQITLPYTNILTSGAGPFSFSWGVISALAGAPGFTDAPADSGWKEAGFGIGSLHMSFVFANDLPSPVARAFFWNRPTAAVGR